MYEWKGCATTGCNIENLQPVSAGFSTKLRLYFLTLEHDAQRWYVNEAMHMVVVWPVFLHRWWIYAGWHGLFESATLLILIWALVGFAFCIRILLALNYMMLRQKSKFSVSRSVKVGIFPPRVPSSWSVAPVLLGKKGCLVLIIWDICSADRSSCLWWLESYLPVPSHSPCM
jgi:hypothetical protein